jgi:hypothetical protein
MRYRHQVVGSLVVLVALAGCVGNDPKPLPSRVEPVVEATLECPKGEDAGGVTWDYGAEPRGVTRDAAAWVRTHARGLDIELDVSFLPVAGQRENVVVAATPEGQPLAVVEFGVDDAGRYFPNAAEACPSSGIEDFSG